MSKKRTATPITGEVSASMTSSPSGNSEDTSTSAVYALRSSDQRRKPRRFDEISSPPKARKPRKKRGPAKSTVPGKTNRRKTVRKQATKTPEKEERLPDWYFHSPPPMRLGHREEKDCYSISYFDDTDSAPGMPFNPIYQNNYPQLKKTRRRWVKTNRGLFDTNSSSTSDLVFKVPSQSVDRKTEFTGKRKADDTMPLVSGAASADGPVVKRQRKDRSAMVGNASAIANSSLNKTSPAVNQGPVGASSKRKADEMDSMTDGVSLDRSLTEIRKAKRQRVEFKLDESDISFLSSSSVNLSFQNQSVSDIFNLSSGSEIFNRTADSIGINISFESSFHMSFNSSFSHLAELI